MTEAEWLACDEPQTLFPELRHARPLSQYVADQLCVACAGLVLPFVNDEGAREAFAWLGANPGVRLRATGRDVRALFTGPARALYDAHHRREQSAQGAAVHLAYDFWAGWYFYAFENVHDYFLSEDAPYRGSLREKPNVYLVAVMRDIFGNPFRPVAFDPAWRTSDAVALARSMYDSRDFTAMPILADALQEAGCENEQVLSHCRDANQVHVRGCWVCDLVLGKS